MDAASKTHLRILYERLRVWRGLNGVVIKVMSNVALRAIAQKNNSPHNTPEMRWLVEAMEDGVCRDPVNPDFAGSVLRFVNRA